MRFRMFGGEGPCEFASSGRRCARRASFQPMHAAMKPFGGTDGFDDFKSVDMVF